MKDSSGWRIRVLGGRDALCVVLELSACVVVVHFT